jgi:hypothetical protein
MKSPITFQYDLAVNLNAAIDDFWIWEDDGLPVDLTDCTAVMQLRRTHAAEAVLLELSTANGRIIIEPAQGKLQLMALPATFASLDGEGVNRPHRLVEGKFTCYPGVTR